MPAPAFLWLTIRGRASRTTGLAFRADARIFPSSFVRRPAGCFEPRGWSKFGFALMCESLLLLAQKKESRKEHPHRRRLRRCTPMLASTGCGKNLGGFGRPQTACRTGAVRRTPVAAARLRRLRRGVIQTPTPLPRAPCLYSGSLERSAEQWRPQEEKDSRVSECCVAARVSRLSLLRAGAAQGTDA
ncbi:hypothetical protein SALB1_1592 [Salinisphaera sp. LB1]|nr:hypothetical protein SALB1_1592 [Salinisphaera sp. LB1]